MRSVSLSILLALTLAACSDDDGVRLATIDQLRVVKISGDQSSPVPEQVAAAPIRAIAGASYSVGPDGYTPEPLVARVEVAASRGRSATGPSGAIVPPGTLVHWHIPEQAGKLYAATTATDDSAYVVNRWAPGTRAGEYQVTAGRLVGADIVTDATWTLIVEPGAPTMLGSVAYDAVAGEPLDLSKPLSGFFARDRYQNPVPDSLVVARWTPQWEIWGPRPSYGLACDKIPLHSQGAGWTVPVVPEQHQWGYCLRLYIEGRDVGLWDFSPRAPEP